MTIITKIPFEQTTLQSHQKYQKEVLGEITRTKGDIAVSDTDLNAGKRTAEQSISKAPVAEIVNLSERKIITVTPNNILIAQYVDENGEIKKSFPSSNELKRLERIIENMTEH